MRGVEEEGFVRERACGAVLGSKESKAMLEVEIITHFSYPTNMVMLSIVFAH